MTRAPGATKLRRQLVEQLVAAGCLDDPALRRAFLGLPRERFLPRVAKDEGLERVYSDQAIVTVKDERGIPASSSSQPSLMARMLEKLDLRPGQRVLEVGAGTGYNAALLARIVGARGKVTSVELDPATARGARRALTGVRSRAKVVQGDGREGWDRGAPYDRIIVTASAPAVSRAWMDQLVDGGLLELPLLLRPGGQAQAIVTLRKQGEMLRSQGLLHGGFMALRDAPGAPVGPPPPTLAATEWIGGAARSLAHMTGTALGGMSRADRQRLLALALSEPRTRALGLRAPLAALGMYLTIEAPEDRLVGAWLGGGLIGPGGGGLAVLAGGRKTLTRIESYGDAEAERTLLDLVGDWRQRGRPDINDLRMEVSFRGDAARVRTSWNTSRRGRTA